MAATLAAVLAAPEVVDLLGAELGVKATAALVAVVNLLVREFTGAPIAGSLSEALARRRRSRSEP